MNTITPVAVIGASGRSGKALCSALATRHHTIIALSRTPSCLTGPYQRRRYCDLTKNSSLKTALEGAALVINTAHARHIPAILQATKAPIIALGSTRKFTRWPDDHGKGVLLGETALKADGRPSLILHPTMIYGAEGEDNVQRLARLLKRLPFIPLPARGHALVQPIEQNDVTHCLCAALSLFERGLVTKPESLVIAGPDAVTYRSFVTSVLHHAGLKPKAFLTLPVSLLMLGAPLSKFLPGFPTIRQTEIRRLLEDKNADITAMRQRLGINPTGLETGLAKLFGNRNLNF